MIHLSTEKKNRTTLPKQAVHGERLARRWRRSDGMFQVCTNVSVRARRESSHASFGWWGRECKSCWISDIRPSWSPIAVATQSGRHCRDGLVHSESLTSDRSTDSSQVFSFFFLRKEASVFRYKQQPIRLEWQRYHNPGFNLRYFLWLHVTVMFPWTKSFKKHQGNVFLSYGFVPNWVSGHKITLAEGEASRVQRFPSSKFGKIWMFALSDKFCKYSGKADTLRCNLWRLFLHNETKTWGDREIYPPFTAWKDSEIIYKLL